MFCFLMKEFDLENYSEVNLGLSMKFTSRSQAREVLWFQNNSINNHLMHLLVNYFIHARARIINKKFRMTRARHTCANHEIKEISKIV